MPNLYLLRHVNAGINGPDAYNRARILDPTGKDGWHAVVKYLPASSLRLDLFIFKITWPTGNSYERVVENLPYKPGWVSIIGQN